MSDFTNAKEFASTSKAAIRRPGKLSARARLKIRDSLLSILSRIGSDDDGPFLRSIYCHHVFDDQVQRFGEVIEILKDLGEFIDTDTCVDMAEGNTPIDGRYFHLSFDDGFQNNFTNTLRTLDRLNVPAILFVPTALVGANWEESEHYCHDVIRYAGVVKSIERDELLAARSAGYQIGSHTRTHVTVAGLQPQQLEEEIAGSKLDLEEMLGEKCDFISWPYGRKSDIDSSGIEAIKTAGYRACFGAFRGSIKPGESVDTFSIPRHHFEVEWPYSHTKYFARGGWEGK